MKSTFEVNIPVYNGEDTWHEVDAYNAKFAAEKYGAKYNEEGDYSLMNGGNVYVLVRKNEDSPIQIFSVSAEPSIEYSAYEIEKPTCRHCKLDLTDKIIAGQEYESGGHSYCSYNCYKKFYENYHKECTKKDE